MSVPIRAKICGLTRRVDAEAAAASGAVYGGVILAPGGRRTVEPAAAARLLEDLALRGVGVFVDAPERQLRDAAGAAGVRVVQLHGDESPEYARSLREEGRWEVWKAVRPRDGEEFAREAARFAGAVDGLLLDGWSAEARGGTGARFPWAAVAAHRGELPSDLQLIVAGGLHPGNVAEAVAVLRPAVVDVSSGVETEPGIKDADAIAAFVAAARDAGR